MYKCTTCAFTKKTYVEVGIHVVHEHFPQEKVPFLCTLCGVQKLSLTVSKETQEGEAHISWDEHNHDVYRNQTESRVHFWACVWGAQGTQ